MREGMNEKKKRLLFDLVLVSFLVAAALFAFVITELSRERGELVVVTVDGERVAEYALSEDGEYSLNGGTNILVIENGAAYIKSATCPDKTCATIGGKISRAGERIVCLPNSLIVEIWGGDDILVSLGVIRCK